MYYIFFIHSSVDGHLGCFHTLAIVNSALLRHSWSNIPSRKLYIIVQLLWSQVTETQWKSLRPKREFIGSWCHMSEGDWVGLRLGDVWSKNWGCAATVCWPFQETSLFHILTPHMVLPGSINMAANTPNPTFHPHCMIWGNEKTVSLIPLLRLAPKGSGTS